MTGQMPEAKGIGCAGAAPGNEPLRRDDGTTLIELMIVIVLLGTMVATILGAVRVALRVSTLTGESAEVETFLVNIADIVANAAPACDYTATVEIELPDGWGATVDHTYLEIGGTAYDWLRGVGTHPACPTPTFDTGLVQKLAIQVTSSEHDVTRTLEVVKSELPAP